MPEPKPIVPLYGRYSSKEMKELFPADPSADFRYLCSPDMRKYFSDETKYLGWRNVWVSLADVQQSLGLNITPQQLDALKKMERDINYERAREIERKTKHDVMSYLREFAEKVELVCPGAGGILHLGATSCTITDHEELAAMKNGMALVYSKLGNLKDRLVQKSGGQQRAGYMADIDFARNELEHRMDSLKARGAKGTTGTQASYLTLFDGDHERVKLLDSNLGKKLGFKDSYTITGQTYPRIVDYQIISGLGLVAEVLKCISADFRADRNLGQTLSHVQDCAVNAAYMASSQWLERTLDDSSERRIIIPEAFYAIDYTLDRIMDAAENMPYETSSYHYMEKGRAINEKSSEALGMAVAAAKLANSVDRMHDFAVVYRDVPCIAYTHFQFAQPATYGKRIDLWAYNFVLALNDMEHAIETEIDGAGDISSGVRNYFLNSRLNQAVVAASKAAHDMRLLQHDQELNEPFAEEQVGSSAMAYKKNPMKAERSNGLSRTKIGLLDASKEINYAFLGTDSVLELVLSTFVHDTPEQKGFTVHESTSRANLMKHMPFLVSEEIMMDAVKRGADRQEMHEVIRRCMLEARENINSGRPNNMLELLRETGKFDSYFAGTSTGRLLDPMRHIGRSREQVYEFGKIEVMPVRERYASKLGIKGQVIV